MEKSELKDYAEKSLVEGYSKEELKAVLVEEGHEEGKVEHVLEEIDDEKFGRSIETSLKPLELEGDSFTVEKSILGNELELKNSEGEVILHTPEEIPEEKALVLNTDEEKVLEVRETEDGVYEMEDPEAERIFLKLEKNIEGLKTLWKIKTADDNHAASVKTGNTASSILRRSSGLLSFIPHSYVIETIDGRELGEVTGERSKEDVYSIEIEDDGSLSKEALVTAVITVDFLETG